MNFGVLSLEILLRESRTSGKFSGLGLLNDTTKPPPPSPATTTAIYVY